MMSYKAPQATTYTKTETDLLLTYKASQTTHNALDTRTDGVKPWPINSIFYMFGNPSLDHSTVGNYALMQKNNGDTFLNSPGSVYIKINNSQKAYANASGWFETSDDRYKHNERPILNPLGLVEQLNPIIYDKTEVDLGADYNGDLSHVTHWEEWGLIAQRVREIPELSFAVDEHPTDDGNSTICAVNDLSLIHI